VKHYREKVGYRNFRKELPKDSRHEVYRSRREGEKAGGRNIDVRAYCVCLAISKKKSSGRVLLIYFLEVVLVFESSFVLSLVEYIESLLKTDLGVVPCVGIS
jgi:hypothetical protein